MNKQEAKKLDQQVAEILQKHLTKNDTIILGVSGGADSIFLLHQLLKTPAKIIVAHLNHKLRPQADRDQKFVEKIATTHNLHAESKAANIAAKSKKSNTEETSRKARYNFFEHLFKKHKANYIITAHHADDNFETILLNLTRGANLQGLAGMQILDQTEKNSPLLRPLLHISKQKISDYLKFHKIPFKNDHTNKDTKMARNFLRHEVIPHLKKLNPNLAETASKNAKHLSETSTMIKEIAQKKLTEIHQKNAKIDAKKFRKLHPALKPEVLRALHHKITKTTRNLESTHLNEVITLIENNIGNKKKKLGQLTISLKNNQVNIEKSPKKRQD